MYAYVEGDPVSYNDPMGEIINLPGIAIGIGIEVAIQAYRNYRDDCDLLDIDNYDWWDVLVSGAFGAVAPGAISTAKTVWTSGNAAKTISRQLAQARTTNRSAKLQRRIDAHTGAITEAVATQASWQGYKFIAKELDGNKPRECACKK